LQHDSKLRTITAPVAGRIGEVKNIPVGTVIRPGEPVATIIPEGPPRVVAWFPASGVGRLRQGQPARLRPDGFA
jgi:membrane fusion protein (multidrug efflux system)